MNELQSLSKMMEKLTDDKSTKQFSESSLNSLIFKANKSIKIAQFSVSQAFSDSFQSKDLLHFFPDSEVPCLYPLLPDALSFPNVVSFPLSQDGYQAVLVYEELYQNFSDKYFKNNGKSIPKDRGIIIIDNQKLLPNGTIIVNNINYYLPNGNIFNGNELKTPDGGIYKLGNYYQYPTGEKAYYDGTVELPNGLRILNTGCVKFPKDLFAPSSLTGQGIRITGSRNILLDPNGIYRIHGKILYPNGIISKNQNKSII